MSSLAPALKLLCSEGMSQDSPLKLRTALREIDRDNKRFGWTDDTIESLPPEWRWRINTARLQMGYMDWRGWEWRAPRGGHDPFEIPRWKIGMPIYPINPEGKEPEKVRSLLIYSEQGLGDMLMFAHGFRYALPFADEITIEVEPRLAPCFERSFPEFKIHALKDLRDASWVEEGQFDAKILMGDVVARFLRSKDKLYKGAYIKPDPQKVDYWRGWLEENVPKPWVGFSWAGRQGYLDTDYAKDGWINLQYGEWDIPDHLITPPIDLMNDLEDVFGIVANLDNVVCIPNTLAHMAGCLGKPCDVVMTPGEGQVNNAVNWRWGMPDERTTKWHPSIRVYRNIKQWLYETRKQ